MVELRPITLDDRELVRNWRNLPEVARFMYTDHMITEEEHARWFERVLADPSCRYWVIVWDGKEVGVANLTAIDHVNSRCYWAFYLADPAVRGRGIGTYVEYALLRTVFEELSLGKLCCEVLATNPNVVALHKSCGFQQEGLFRRHVTKGGVPLDVVCLAMLKEEWERARPQLEERLRAKGLLRT